MLHRQTWKFAKYGFWIGIAYALFDLLGWRGSMLLPWSTTSGIAINLMHFLIGGIVFGAIAGLIGFFVKRPV
jgi:hypothetical protein